MNQYGDNSQQWSAAQLLTTARILHQCDQHGAPARARHVALLVALAESTCLCLASDAVQGSASSSWAQGKSAGDATSCGVMQQQDAWASVANRMNPYGATQRFLTGGDAGQTGLLQVKGWESMEPAEAATRVQQNATGAEAYAKQEALAQQLLHIFAQRA